MVLKDTDQRTDGELAAVGVVDVHYELEEIHYYGTVQDHRINEHVKRIHEFAYRSA